MSAAKRWAQTKESTEGYPEDLLSHLSSLRAKKRFREAKRIAGAWFSFALGDILSFTPDELAQRSNMEIETCSNFLAFGSLSFGKVTLRDYWPAPAQPMQFHGLVEHEGRYLCAVPYSIVAGLRPLIEDRLKASEVWQRYETHRASYLDGRWRDSYPMRCREL